MAIDPEPERRELAAIPVVVPPVLPAPASPAPAAPAHASIPSLLVEEGNDPIAPPSGPSAPAAPFRTLNAAPNATGGAAALPTVPPPVFGRLMQGMTKLGYSRTEAKERIADAWGRLHARGKPFREIELFRAALGGRVDEPPPRRRTG